MNQTMLIGKLSKCISSLILTIENENKLLKEGKLSSISPIIEKKMVNLQEFDQIQYELEDLLRNSGINKNDPNLLKLKNLFTKLNQTNYENDLLLKTNIEVSHMLIESYKNTKKEITVNQFGYNNRGQNIAPANLERVMPPVSLNSKV